nr:hypothetical protein [Tanacetum cinerariifolium]
MSTPTFAETHSLVAFLEKPSKFEGFEQIIDFLNAKPIRYPLTVNPKVYASCCKQFWTTAKVKKVNGQEQIQALVDKQKVIITEESIRCDLKFDDAEGTACLPNDIIFEELGRISAKTTAWNEFSSAMASAIICLANNQKFNFSKYIFDRMVKNLEGGVKFLMFLRFLQLFLDEQVEGMAKHNEMYVISSHTKKFFANMRRQGQGFSGNEKDNLGTQDDASKQGRSIEDIDQDAEIALVDEAQGRMHDAYMLGVDDLKGNEVFVDVRDKTVEKDVSTADLVTIAGEVVTAASVKDSAAPSTATTANVDDELTMAKTLIAIKAAKPKVISTAITTPRAKGKEKMIKPKNPVKKKDQIALDEEVARKLEVKKRAKMEEEERIAREKDKANRDVVEEWDDV